MQPFLYAWCGLFLSILLRANSSNSHKPKLNTDLLPDLQTILKSLNLDSYLSSFVKNGITETRYLLRLSRMDFQLMEIDWEMPKEDINDLKDKITEMIETATVEEVPFIERNRERDTLRYGRIYIPDSVQSYEFILASFGGHPAIGPQQLCLSPIEDGCQMPPLRESLEACIHVVRYNSSLLLVIMIRT
jgi:hypothetical protein